MRDNLLQGFPLHYIVGWVIHSLLQQGDTQKLYKSLPQDIGVGVVTGL